MTHRSIDAASLIAAWREAGELNPQGTEAVAAAIRADAAQERPPLHLKILSALGTFLATAFFLAFLLLSDLIAFDGGGSMLVWGLVFLAIGIALSLAKARTAAGIGRDALAQTAFTAMALGKVMTVIGVVMLAGEETRWAPTAALLAVTLATYPVSGSSLDRVLSPYAVGASVLFEILERGPDDPSLPLALLFAMAAAVAGLLLLPHRAPLALRPVGLAALGLMGTIVSILASGRDAGFWAGQPFDPRPIEGVLTLALVGVLAWAGGSLRALATPPLAAATFGVLLLGFAGAPGIGFALLVLVVGHALHDLPMRVVGVLALPVFLVLWYYGRDMTFLEKSATLVGSGVLLLIGRALVVGAGWDREDAA